MIVNHYTVEASLAVSERSPAGTDCSRLSTGLTMRREAAAKPALGSIEG